MGGLIAHFACSYRLPAGRWVVGAGVASGLVAGSFALWAKHTMTAGGTNIHPNLPALAIVTGGPFAITRNPLYLSLVLLFTGIGLVLRSPAFLALLAPLALVLHFGVVLREERYLDAKFGEDYRRYNARVRRWI